jgi:hypothetical protein
LHIYRNALTLKTILNKLSFLKWENKKPFIGTDRRETVRNRVWHRMTLIKFEVYFLLLSKKLLWFVPNNKVCEFYEIFNRCLILCAFTLCEYFKEIKLK